MCQETRTLGQGSQNQPNGNRNVSNPVGGCPLKDLASIMVEVYEGSTATILKDQEVKVTLDGPSAGQALAYATATKYVTKLTPGTRYQVNVATVSGSRHEGGTIKSDSFGEGPFALGNGETKRVVFRLYPPTTTLVVHVVDQNTNRLITEEDFKVVVPRHKSTGQSGKTGKASFPDIEPGNYENISVDFGEDRRLKSRYRLARLATRLVERGKTAEVEVRLLRRRLELTLQHKKFAPGVEDAGIGYSILGLQDQRVTLRIISEKYPGAVLFEQELAEDKGEKTDGTHSFAWKGLANRGALNGKYVHPLLSPFKVILQHDDDLRDEGSISVLYHSLGLELGEWMAPQELEPLDRFIQGEHAADFAGTNCADPRVIQWVWQKLGSLGYFPGLATNSLSDDLKKAIRRYRQGHRELFRRSYAFSSQEGDFAHQADVLAALAQIDAPLLRCLSRGDNNRLPGIVEPQVIAGTVATGRLRLDVDRFYVGLVGEFETGRKVESEREWLNSPLLPIKATLFVQDHNGAKQRSPGAGPARIRWTWDDEQEDIDRLPDYSPAAPSYTRKYVRQALERVQRKLPAPVLGGGGRHHANAPTAAGGTIGSDEAANSRAAFRPYRDLFDWQDDAAGGGSVKLIEDADSVWAGTATVWLAPSRIAGDNYRLTASLDRAAWPKDVDEAHAAIEPEFEKQTGRITVWRRLRIAAYLKWGNVAALDAAKWDEIRAEYAQAFVELEGPAGDATLQVSNPPAAAGSPQVDLQAGFRAVCDAHENPRWRATAYSTQRVFDVDPRTEEFKRVPAASYGTPGYMINALMVGPIQSDMILWRNTKDQQSQKKPDKKLFRMRGALAVEWTQAMHPAWVQAAGNHFAAEYRRLANDAAGWEPRDLPLDQRYVAPLTNMPDGLPDTQVDVVDRLFAASVRRPIEKWSGGQPLDPAEKELLGAVRELAESYASEKSPTMHGLVRECASYYSTRLGRMMKKQGGRLAASDHELRIYLKTPKPAVGAGAAVAAPPGVAGGSPASGPPGLPPPPPPPSGGSAPGGPLAGSAPAFPPPPPPPGASAATNPPPPPPPGGRPAFPPPPPPPGGAAGGSPPSAPGGPGAPPLAAPGAARGGRAAGPVSHVNDPEVLAVKTRLGNACRIEVEDLSMKDRTVVLYVWSINYDADLTEALKRMTGVQDVCWTRRDLLGLRFQPQPEAAAGWDAEYRAAYARWQLEQVAGDTLNFLNQTTMKLTEAIDDAVRARLSRPDGVIVVHYGSHQPADIVTRSPADLRGYLNSGGFGWSGGLCWCSNDLPLEVYHLFAHEIAHAAYLRHCRRGKERFVPGWSHPNDHDHYDDNCMMSYSEYSTRLSWPEIPSPPLLQQEAEQLVRDLTGRDANWKRNAGRDMSIIQTQGNPYNVGADAEWANPIFTHTIFGDATHHYNADRFRPHFCGKCNFRLRGWDVAATLPYNVPPEPDVPHHDRIGQSPVLPWATDNAERPRAPLEIRYSSLKSQTVPTGYGAALWFSPDVQGFINPQINTSAQDRNFSWSEVNDQWAGLSCLNVGQQGEGQIVFLPHFKFNEFTDPIHEICHYFQEFNSNAQALYEGITEVLAALLSLRIQKRLRRDGHAALVERFHYAFNLSYAQATWFAFDCLIPRMGLANVAKMFTFDDHALLRAVLLDSARGEDLLVDAVRNLIKSDLEQSGRIRAESFGRWQTAKALFIPEPAVPPPHADPGVTLAIRTQVQAELEEARTSFCAWLEEMLAKVPAPGNAAKSSLATLDDSPERNYKIAKHLRIYSWVRYKETAKKQSEDFQHMHFKALQLDDDVREKQNHITLLKRELHSATSLDSW